MLNPFTLADSIRYSDDKKLKDVSIDRTSSQLTLSWISTSGLRVSEHLTPELYARLEKVCDKFNLPVNNVEAYVVSDPNINAWCYRTGENSCLVVFNSEIINLLTFDEIEFIIGHELGHYLLDHHFILGDDNKKTKEDYFIQRAQEISSDRIGLWACEDLEIAMRCIIKLTSGLKSEFLRFDVNAFLSQTKSRKVNYKHMEHSTHPSFILRAEALIRFSTTKEFLSLHKKSGGSSLSTVDKLIKKDLKKYVSQDFDVRHNDVEEQLKLWSLIYFCVKDGDLTKDEQNIISRIFGVDKKTKLLRLIKNKSRAQVISTAKDKLEEAIRIFKETNPLSSWFKLRGVLRELEEESGFKGFYDNIMEDL